MYRGIWLARMFRRFGWRNCSGYTCTYRRAAYSARVYISKLWPRARAKRQRHARFAMGREATFFPWQMAWEIVCSRMDYRTSQWKFLAVWERALLLPSSSYIYTDVIKIEDRKESRFNGPAWFFSDFLYFVFGIDWELFTRSRYWESMQVQRRILL